MSNHSMCCTTHTTYTTSSPTNSSSGSQEAMPATGKSCREKVMAMLLPFLQALPVPAESKLCQHGLQPQLWLQRREQASGDLGHILSQGSNLPGSEHYSKCKDRKHGTYWDFPVACCMARASLASSWASVATSQTNLAGARQGSPGLPQKPLSRYSSSWPFQIWWVSNSGTSCYS